VIVIDGRPGPGGDAYQLPQAAAPMPPPTVPAPSTMQTPEEIASVVGPNLCADVMGEAGANPDDLLWRLYFTAAGANQEDQAGPDQAAARNALKQIYRGYDGP